MLGHVVIIILALVQGAPLKPKSHINSIKEVCKGDPQSISKSVLLGMGSFGSVHEGTFEDQQVAIKEVLISTEEDEDSVSSQKQMLDEIQIMQKISEAESPASLLRLLGTYHLESWADNGKLRVGLIMELVDGIDLELGIGLWKESLLNAPYNERVIFRVIKSVLLGLQFLHQNNILHRDIKPANIMVCRLTGQVKLFDFGMSRETDSLIIDTSCSLGYASPELLTGIPHGKPHDLWTLGATAFEMHTGIMPLALIPIFDEKEIFEYIKDRVIKYYLHQHVYGNIAKYLTTLSKPAKLAIEMTLMEEPERRPTVDTLLKGFCFKEQQIATKEEMVDMVNHIATARQ